MIRGLFAISDFLFDIGEWAFDIDRACYGAELLNGGAQSVDFVHGITNQDAVFVIVR